MWQLISFDAATTSRELRKAYRCLRKKILSDGFMMLHESLYCRWFETEEKAENTLNDLGDFIPPQGDVAILNLTDIQYEKAHFFKNGELTSAPPIPTPFTCL